MKQQTIIRKVLIRERELKTLRYRALVKSEHGNRKLYDTCEWRPLDKKDMLIYMLKGKYPQGNFVMIGKLKAWMLDKPVYDPRYMDWDLWMIDGILHITPLSGPSSYEPFGWATLTKVKGLS